MFEDDGTARAAWKREGDRSSALGTAAVGLEAAELISTPAACLIALYLWNLHGCAGFYGTASNNHRDVAFG